MTRTDHRFQDWKTSAQDQDILIAAIQRGAKLKRAGREHIGPCPACGGTDRFSINPQKRIFNCRGAEGGNVIKMVMHIDGVSFTQACEALTGEPPPKGEAKPLSASEQAEREKRREDNEARQRARDADQQAYADDTRETAQAIWDASVPIAGTLAESYLIRRGIPVPESGWPAVLRFHQALPYPKRGNYPVFVCRVEDVVGDLTAVWRIFLRSDGRKADVPNAKLGLGPAGGGAVRIGGLGAKVGLAEGIESALGAWHLTGRRYPVWAALSTAGLTGIELPLGIEHVVIFPDGDRPINRKDGEFVTAVPAGRKAAVTARTSILEAGIGCTIAAEPPAGKDYLDMWQSSQREVA